jgi:hypothetical protein
VAPVQAFLRGIRFSPVSVISSSTHLCILLLTEGQTGEAREPCSSRTGEHWTGKYFSVVFPRGLNELVSSYL